MGFAALEVTADQLEKFRARVALKPPPDDDEVKVDPKHEPGDPVALRGVPLVGVQGVGGVISGTRPGDPVWRLLKDDAYLRRPRKKR